MRHTALYSLLSRMAKGQLKQFSNWLGPPAGIAQAAKFVERNVADMPHHERSQHPVGWGQLLAIVLEPAAPYKYDRSVKQWQTEHLHLRHVRPKAGPEAKPATTGPGP